MRLQYVAASAGLRQNSIHPKLEPVLSRSRNRAAVRPSFGGPVRGLSAGRAIGILAAKPGKRPRLRLETRSNIEALAEKQRQIDHLEEGIDNRPFG